MSLWFCVELAAKISAWSLGQGLQALAFTLSKTRETPEMTALRVAQRRTDELERCMVYLVEQSRERTRTTQRTQSMPLESDDDDEAFVVIFNSNRNNLTHAIND